MNVLRRFMCLALVPFSVALADGPDNATASPGNPLGDVLHPGRASAGLVWHLGFDAGLTYSMFSNGPISYTSANPFWSKSTALPLSQFPLESTVNEGNGLGFVAGLAADLSLSKMVGIVLKLNYHTRVGSFDNNTDNLLIHPDTRTNLTSVFNDKVDWTFSYIGIDLLARVQLLEDKLYLLVGPSFGSLLKSNAKLTQTIVRPDDIYYTEEVYQTSPTERMLRQAESEQEVSGFDESRVDLKAGLGWWIPLSENLFLTPEVTVAIPLTKLASSVDGKARFSSPFTASNPKWNMVTIFGTVGLRWRLQ